MQADPANVNEAVREKTICGSDPPNSSDLYGVFALSAAFAIALALLPSRTLYRLLNGLLVICAGIGVVMFVLLETHKDQIGERRYGTDFTNLYLFYLPGAILSARLGVTWTGRIWGGTVAGTLCFFIAISSLTALNPAVYATLVDPFLALRWAEMALVVAFYLAVPAALGRYFSPACGIQDPKPSRSA